MSPNSKEKLKYPIKVEFINAEEEKRWIEREIERIGWDKLEDLAKKTVVFRERAYKPYSKYKVGAMILCGPCVEQEKEYDEELFEEHGGTNVECAHFRASCAEDNAIYTAIGTGVIDRCGKNFIRAVVVAHSGDSAPCGDSRQKIREFTDNCLILDVNGEGTITLVTSLNSVFEYAFGPEHL